MGLYVLFFVRVKKCCSPRCWISYSVIVKKMDFSYIICKCFVLFSLVLEQFMLLVTYNGCRAIWEREKKKKSVITIVRDWMACSPFLIWKEFWEITIWKLCWPATKRLNKSFVKVCKGQWMCLCMLENFKLQLFFLLPCLKCKTFGSIKVIRTAVHSETIAACPLIIDGGSVGTVCPYWNQWSTTWWLADSPPNTSRRVP